MKKNNINIYYMQKIFFLLIICLFILTGCNNKNDDEKLKSKIRDQISYLEKDLISMLNGFNNISYSNYKIEKRQGAQSSQTNTLIEENKKQGSTNGESLQETKQNNDSVEKSSNESESDNMNDNNSNASNQGNSSIIMVPNSILLSDINQKIDWNNMKYEIEKIYSTWNSLFIDLNSLEKGNTKTLEFSSTLNDTTKSIKAENKIASMQNIAEMYIKLGDYSKSYTNDNLQINIIDTKKNIIQAYVYVTENNWDMAYFRCIGKYHSGNIYYWQFVVSLLLLNPLLSICPFFKNYCAVVIFFLLCLFSIALNFIQTKVGILLNLFKCSR